MLHYTDCGLRNVWLMNGYRRARTPYGPANAIRDLEGLHKAIGLWVARKPGRLTGAELRFLRKELDLSQRALAEYLGCEEQTVSLWERRGRLTKMADRFVRALYREAAEGNAKIRELVERIREKDAPATGRASFTLRGRAWRAAA